MVKNRLTFGLIVKDYEEAIDFYTQKLGFVVVEDVLLGHDRWITIALPGQRECAIALHQAQSDSDMALIGKQFGSSPFLGMETDDCIGDYRRMQALGVTFHGEPEVQPYGTGVMFEDLYGNRIFLNQEPV